MNRLFILLLFLCCQAACSRSAQQNVAVLIFEHTGLYEVFGGRFNVYTVAETTVPVATISCRVTPVHAHADTPKPDLVVVPGGGGHHASRHGAWAHTLIPDAKAVLDWVRATPAIAVHILTVCNSAFNLACDALADRIRLFNFRDGWGG